MPTNKQALFRHVVCGLRCVGEELLQRHGIINAEAMFGHQRFHPPFAPDPSLIR
jgi:hypothetical protein